MKLLEVTLHKAISSMSTASLRAGDSYELSFEAGLVTVTRLKFPDEPPWLIPAANVAFMRPAPAEAKRKP